LSNLPDRSAGQGQLEQALIDNYMKENPNVKIELEALQDEPYKQKFKAYASGNQLPDLYMVWGQAAFFGPVMKEGYAAELNKDDFKDYGFFPGSTNGFKMNGKLYGLPRNTDFYVLYYNKKVFADNGVKVPESFEDVIEAAKVFRSKGIAPMATAGKDKWPISSLIQEVMMKRQGNLNELFDILGGKVKATESQALAQAAKDMKTLMDAKLFQDSFASADYGTAQNLFAQGKAAMFFMGSWDVSMAANTAFSDLPLLLSIIARNGFAPRQFAKRGERLSFSNGILLLGIMAA
jgi:raffinose/stachyose/melibiose transport system substrate-binding protein